MFQPRISWSPLAIALPSFDPQGRPRNRLNCFSARKLYRSGERTEPRPEFRQTDSTLSIGKLRSAIRLLVMPYFGLAKHPVEVSASIARLSVGSWSSIPQLLESLTPRLLYLVLCFHRHSRFVPSNSSREVESQESKSDKQSASYRLTSWFGFTTPRLLNPSTP
jgi:hypothetical protein